MNRNDLDRRLTAIEPPDGAGAQELFRKLLCGDPVQVADATPAAGKLALNWLGLAVAMRSRGPLCGVDSTPANVERVRARIDETWPTEWTADGLALALDIAADAHRAFGMPGWARQVGA